jgi:hypothetical protein
MMKGEKITSNFFLKLKYFSPLRILTSALFEESLVAFLFLPLFSFFFFSNTFSLFFFYAPSLEDLRVLMILRRKITSSKTFISNGLTWNGMVVIVDILLVDEYSGMELCTSI